jgi:hypothetical protein
MAAEQEHGGRWSGFGPEPMTNAEWQAHLRESTDADLDELCGTPFLRERLDAQDERDARIDRGDWIRDA